MTRKVIEAGGIEVDRDSLRPYKDAYVAPVDVGAFLVECHADRERWLAGRRPSIGGSDIVQLVGIPVDGRELRGPYWLWLEKNPAAWEKLGKQGQDGYREMDRAFLKTLNVDARLAMEPVIQKWAEERDGVTIEDAGHSIFRAKEFPRRHCSPDGLVLSEMDRTKAVLKRMTRKLRDGDYETEASYKTVSPFMRREWETGPSDYAILQAHWTMLVTGWDHIRLYAQVGYGDHDRDRLSFVIERDERLIEELLEVERVFWRHVDEDTPPPLDGWQGTTEALRLLYPPKKERVVVALDPSFEMIGGHLDEALADRKSAEAEVKHLKQLVEEAIAKQGGTEGLVEGQDADYTFKRQVIDPTVFTCPHCEKETGRRGGYVKIQHYKRRKKE